MEEKTPITVAYGDGIGPEIMDATLKIIQAAGAKIDVEVIEIGEKVYLSGNNAGIAPESWDSLRRTKVFLKAPITTPQGSGYKSLNVTTRKMFGLYANVRPCVSYHPFIKTKHPVMDLVIVRENEEDLYAGIEHRQTRQVTQALKIISQPGTERIVRYAFEFAKHNGRKKVTCFVKDNIMKITDGLFHKTFNEVGEEYPDIEKEVWIVDIGAAKLATSPEQFDVLVMENLYGDILSDVTAQMTGSVGLGGSANVGSDFAMFEAIHGSAPRRAGQNSANPSGLLLGAVMMLVHIGQPDVATKVHNAWMKTLEDGIHTYDVNDEVHHTTPVGTKEFAEEVIKRLGQKPEVLKAVEYSAKPGQQIKKFETKDLSGINKELMGVDIFLDWNSGSAEDLGNMLTKIKSENMELLMISNRGVKVYPQGAKEISTVDHWRCRYLNPNKNLPVTHSDILDILGKLRDSGFDFIKTENLYNFDGEAGYSLAQGQ
ncbi:MAG: NADP-dependent isocitrate dehydrogenase [Ignavibacteria bacterium]|jgi:isocitrate dehydrogenase|nr:NADP-dependent isocitrate dehydrogenase [Ignavibacteria bacterium]